MTNSTVNITSDHHSLSQGVAGTIRSATKMRQRAKTTTPAIDAASSHRKPRNNLDEQLESIKSENTTSKLQQCMNSHVISAYLNSRTSRRANESGDGAHDIDVDATTQKGAAAMTAFRQLHMNEPLRVTPFEPAASSARRQPIPFDEGEPHQLVDKDDENPPVLERVESPGRESRYQRPARRESTNNNWDTQRRPSDHVSDDFGADDSLFDAVDLDVLVASRQPQATGRSSTNSTTSKHNSQSSVGNTHVHSNPPTSRVQLSSAPSSIRDEIQLTRDRLRRIREECDDASLEGDVPHHLLATRRSLEEKLNSLSRQYRDELASGGDADSVAPVSSSNTSVVHTKLPTTTSSGSGSRGANPRCSCGMETIEARVQHGPNANRLYNRCNTCGFHSFAEPGGHQLDRSTRLRDTEYVDKACQGNASLKEKMRIARGVLHDVFGHSAFRANQERIVMEAFAKRDIFVLMPTGGGKSLCYQLPACIDEGVTVVISPLVSLIQDQVQQLEALEVDVAHLNGEQDYETVQRPIISNLFSSKPRIKLLYVTPEKIASSNTLNNVFESLEKRGLLARFVVDEAHCISQWGHDFRKDYLQLGQLRARYRTVPIMALTATASHQTEADIAKNLQLKAPFVTRSSFNRPNLIYTIRRKSSKFMEDIAKFVREHDDDSGIIYCLSKNDCEQVAKRLIKALGFEGTPRASSISFYHAGLEAEDRAFRHTEWSKGKIKLIVATVAFGMGINKPDVRYVIHHTIPQSVTHYYQEAGRAGRDGDVAQCILYYSFADLSRRRKLILKDKDNLQHKNVHLEHLRRMGEFCENQVECRRTSLLEYFGEHFSSEKCRATCDNCRSRAQGFVAEKTDVTAECSVLLRIVRDLHAENESPTLIQVSQAYLGQVSKGNEFKKEKLASLSGYGAGKGRFGRSEVERILSHMILRHYLREVDKTNKMGFTTTFLAVGSKASELDRGGRVSIVCKTRYEKPVLRQQPATSKKSKNAVDKKPKKKSRATTHKSDSKVASTSSSRDSIEELSDDFDDDVVVLAQPPSSMTRDPLIPVSPDFGRIPKMHVESLAQLLKDWRASVCDNLNVMPYHILTTGGIAAIANAAPTTSAELSDMEGVGRIRVKKYGSAIIEIVKSYLDKHNISPTPVQTTSLDSNGASSEMSRFEASPPRVEFDEDGINWGALDENALIQGASRPSTKRHAGFEDDAFRPTKTKRS